MAALRRKGLLKRGRTASSSAQSCQEGDAGEEVRRVCARRYLSAESISLVVAGRDDPTDGAQARSHESASRARGHLNARRAYPDWDEPARQSAVALLRPINARKAGAQ
jgi:hypothetical protein